MKLVKPLLAVALFASSFAGFGVAAMHTGATAAHTTTQTMPTAEKVNINTADLAKLMSVHGMTKRAAHAIIAFREKNGSFSSLDQLANVQGVNKKVLEKISPLLTV